MMTNGELLTWHERALDDVEAVVRAVTPDGLGASTPCAGWDLRALLEHMVGQNHGFAAAFEAAEGRDVDASAYGPRTLDGGAPAAWSASARRVAAAFARGVDGPDVRVAALSEHDRLAPPAVVRAHLLDTVVHAWDVATALARPYRPDARLVEIVLAAARAMPPAAREGPGPAFGPARAEPVDTDPWARALALLGRAER